MNQRRENAFTLPDGTPVSRLGQGTYLMGMHQKDAMKALQRGLELGMAIIDTAEMYENEDVVGQAVSHCRSKAFIVSKVLPSNATRKGTKRACEKSLKRLKTDYIDLYLLHWEGRCKLGEAIEAFAELQNEGKIRRWGVSNISAERMQDILQMPGGDACTTDQVLYNPEDRGIEFDLIPWSQRNGIPLMAYTPLGSKQLRSHPAIVSIARRHNATPAQVLIAWVLRVPEMIAIPKASAIEHVEDNAKSLDLTLTAEDLAEIDAAFPPPACKTPMPNW